MAANQKKKVVILVQARMGSTRLPGKHLKTILGRPLISFLFERLNRAEGVDAVVLATTLNPKDDVLADFAKTNRIPYFRGSEEDVLDRYLQAARVHQADIVVRITGDCPLIDPAIISQMLKKFVQVQPPCDYMTNGLERTYPRGMDVEIFTFKALEKAAQAAVEAEEREHVTPYFYRHPELFAIESIKRDQDDSRYRWTVDTPEDLELIKVVLETVYPKHPQFTLDDLLRAFHHYPQWVEINSHIKQKPLKL